MTLLSPEGELENVLTRTHRLSGPFLLGAFSIFAGRKKVMLDVRGVKVGRVLADLIGQSESKQLEVVLRLRT